MTQMSAGTAPGKSAPTIKDRSVGPSRLLRFVLPALLAVPVFLSSCSDSSPKSDIFEYCTPMSASATRPPEAAVVLDPADHRPSAGEVSHFLIATEYPLTTLDASAYAQAAGNAPPDGLSIHPIDLAVVDASSIAPTDPVVGRAEFEGFDLLVAHLPRLGTDRASRSYDGILGGDLLRRYAMRLAYQPDVECRLPWSNAQFPTVTFFREVTDENDELAADGFAVISFDLSGGGRFLLSGQGHDFGATRIGVGACVEPDPFDPQDIPEDSVGDQDALAAAIPVTGTDAFLLVATGTVPMVFGESFFSRLTAGQTQDASSQHQLRDGSIFEQDGTIRAKVTRLSRVVLVGDTSDGLGPCGELARRRRIAWIRTHKTPEKWDSGPWHVSTAGPAVVEFDGDRSDATATASLDAYVIPDTSSLFQGIRFELGSDLPQIDGLVGHEFLRHFEVILDYPKQRLILRCSPYQSQQNGACNSETQTAPCCDEKGRCVCPSTVPCCQYPATKIP